MSTSTSECVPIETPNSRAEPSLAFYVVFLLQPSESAAVFARLDGRESYVALVLAEQLFDIAALEGLDCMASRSTKDR